MRHVAVGRHARYPLRPTRWSYLIVALAVTAAIVASFAIASQSDPAQARPAAFQNRILPDQRVSLAIDKKASNTAREKTVAARVAAGRVRAAHLAAALTYTVRTGDTLSSVAARHCGQARAWTGIYAASRARGMTARNANMLTAGQHLWLHCGWVPQALKFAPLPLPPMVHTTVTVTAVSSSGDSDAEGGTASAPVYHRSYHHSYSAPVASGTYHGSGSMQQCIISRESGGNSQVMNSSGHYGLYQFSASTWAASGGSAADFGHASVAEQNRVFYNAVAARGYSDWTPYDGCL